jgi:hypothetical protein
MILPINPVCRFTIIPFITTTWTTKAREFFVHISTIALSDVLTEWNPRVPWIVFHSSEL